MAIEIEFIDLIRKEDITEIGAFYKPHGIKGEITAGFDYDLDPMELRCIIVEIDGIFVPFFIDSCRPKGRDSFLIKLHGIDDETEASGMAKRPIYGVTAELDLDDDPSDGMYLYDMIGFTMYDGDKSVGTITGIEDSTENILFIVEPAEGAKPVYVPFVDDWIESFDPEEKTIKMHLPEGIVTLN